MAISDECAGVIEVTGRTLESFALEGCFLRNEPFHTPEVHLSVERGDPFQKTSETRLFLELPARESFLTEPGGRRNPEILCQGLAVHIRGQRLASPTRSAERPPHLPRGAMKPTDDSEETRLLFL